MKILVFQWAAPSTTGKTYKSRNKFGSTTKGKRNTDVYIQQYSVTYRLISEYLWKPCYNNIKNKNIFNVKHRLKPVTTHRHKFPVAGRMLGGDLTESKSPSWNVAWGCEKHQAEWSSQIENFGSDWPPCPTESHSLCIDAIMARTITSVLDCHFGHLLFQFGDSSVLQCDQISKGLDFSKQLL